jgi:hypothetical protein
VFRTFYNEFQNVLAVLADNEKQPFLLPEKHWTYIGDRTVSARISRQLKLVPVYFITCSTDPYDAALMIGASPKTVNVGQTHLQSLRKNLQTILTCGPLWARKPAGSQIARDLDPV